MFDDIKTASEWIQIEKIEKGWSSDTKYYIKNTHGDKLLLRVSARSTYDAKKEEYEFIKRVSKLGFEMSKPLDMGLCDNGEHVYMLLTWVEGVSVEDVIADLSVQEQYQIGRKAGRILRQIHSIPIPKELLPEQTKIPKKLNQLEKYLQSDVRITEDEEIVTYIKKNIDKLWSVPPVYQHGDFHPGNLILTKDQQIGVIDFNRWSIGDPYEEFYKLESFGTDVSIPYCIGQIDAYFNGDVPEEFWKVLSVYVAHSSLYSIKWAEKFGRKDIQNMRRICEKSLKHYDNFRRIIPNWYTEYSKDRVGDDSYEH